MEPILFYRVGEPYGFMSNFAPFPIDVDGLTWPTSEHYFQAQKFPGLAHQETIRTTVSPMDAARLGRQLHPLRADWDAVKDEIMMKALRAKFSQHHRIRRQLLETGPAELVENTDKDSYWANGGDGRGLNRLGQLLMQLRSELTTREP